MCKIISEQRKPNYSTVDDIAKPIDLACYLNLKKKFKFKNKIYIKLVSMMMAHHLRFSRLMILFQLSRLLI